MITPLPGWSWAVEDGGVTLRFSGAPARATIRYRERVAPLRSASAIAHERAARLRGARVGPIRPLVTHEGEYGALVSIDGAEGGRRARWTLGLVFADDSHTEIEGLALGPALFEPVAAAVERLTVADRLLLGVRRRRFVYQPPPGWYGHGPLDLHAHWFPPGYPRDARMLVVYPALPRNAGASSSPAGGEPEVLRTGPTTSLFVDEICAGPAPLETGRLAGHAWEIACHDAEGRRWLRRVVVLTCDRYGYALFYDRARDQDDGSLGVLDAVLRSIEPLPSGERRQEAAASVLDHWT